MKPRSARSDVDLPVPFPPQFATYPQAGYQSLLPKLIPAMAKVAATKDKSHFVTRTPHGGLTQTVKASPDKIGQMVTQDEFVSRVAYFQEPSLADSHRGPRPDKRTHPSSLSICHSQYPLWAKFFKEGDAIISEIGCASFGLLDVQIPKNATLDCQVVSNLMAMPENGPGKETDIVLHVW